MIHPVQLIRRHSLGARPPSAAFRWNRRTARTNFPPFPNAHEGVRVPRKANAAFTLVELIFVMVLLIIVASMVAPRMSSFFRGRVLTSEARRMLSLVNYAQSRAIAEGVPVLLWIDVTRSTYGVEVQGGHSGADERTPTFAVEPSLRLEVPSVSDAPESENGDEQLGLAESLPSIRFNPDGFFDEVSVRKIVIHQGEDGALELVPTANRLAYEILPVSRAN